MSAASIDRYLAPAKAGDGNLGNSATKASPLLCSSIKVRKAGDEVEDEPGTSKATWLRTAVGSVVRPRRRKYPCRECTGLLSSKFPVSDAATRACEATWPP